MSLTNVDIAVLAQLVMISSALGYVIGRIGWDLFFGLFYGIVDGSEWVVRRWKRPKELEDSRYYEGP